VSARASGLAAVAGYLGTIVAANWAIARFGLVPVGFGLTAPAGVFFVGLAFSLRDATQETLGRWPTIACIVVGAVLSTLLAPLRFALASGLTFLISEICDFAIYTPLRERSRLLALTLSNIGALVIDSIIFLSIAFGSLAFLAGQIVGKAEMTVLAVVLVRAVTAWQRRRQSRLAVA
jgi:uncharacterized PurR-regulated membrane protein YhhQ (DUF165 family)